VFGILLAFGMLFPNMPMYIFFIPIPVKAKWVVLAYGLLELYFGISGNQPGVAHFAHLGGMIAGIVMILYWKQKGTLTRGNGFY
jgi:membrane associated rhomboid family serine protease